MINNSELLSSCCEVCTVELKEKGPQGEGWKARHSISLFKYSSKLSSYLPLRNDSFARVMIRRCHSFARLDMLLSKECLAIKYLFYQCFMHVFLYILYYYLYSRRLDRSLNKALKKRIDLIDSRGFKIHNNMKEITIKLVKEYNYDTEYERNNSSLTQNDSVRGERIEIEFEAQEGREDEDDLMRVFDVCIYPLPRHPILQNPLDSTSTPPFSSYLVISCTFAPKYKQISVRHVPLHESVTSPNVYDGPHLFDLPKNIQVLYICSTL